MPHLYKFPECVVCRRPCIPMADFEPPTCIRCDVVMETILARAHVAPAAQLVPRGQLMPCGTHSAFTRHKARGEHVDDLCVVAERIYQANRYQRRKAAAA